MMAVRQSRWSLSAVAIVAAVTWLFASNHCAIAALSHTAKLSAHSCCHKEGEAQDKPHQASQCCDAFSVPVPDQAVAPSVKLYELEVAWIPVSSISEVAVEHLVSSPPNTTGPPGVESFSALVLQKGLPAHAPPHFVV